MTVVCPGSFDPVTHGHFDIIVRAVRTFGDVIVAVGQNLGKNYLFTLDERVALMKQATSGMDGVTVRPMDGLLVDFCHAHDARVVVKGVRFAADFDVELQMAHLNAALGEIETVLLPASPQWGTLSSTFVRDIARHGGDVSRFVPAAVAEQIRWKTAQSRQENSHG